MTDDITDGKVSEVVGIRKVDRLTLRRQLGLNNEGGISFMKNKMWSIFAPSQSVDNKKVKNISQRG